jgi:hypothetical protein
MYKVNDGMAATNGLHNFRIIMNQSDYDILDEVTNRYTDDYVPCTVIYDESKAFYDVGAHFKGSLGTRGADYDLRRGWRVGFNADDLFRGVHSAVTLDRSCSSFCTSILSKREILIKHILNRVGDISSQYDDLVRFMPAPNSGNYSYAQLQLARFSNNYLDSAFTDGGDGVLVKQELIYHPTQTVDGDPESPKLHNTNAALYPHPPIGDLGDSKEDYRGTYLRKNNRDRDDYGRIIEMAKSFDLTGSAFLAEAEQILDLDQWIRAYAWTGLVATFDNYFGSNTPHNHYLYVRPSDSKVIFLPWDNDFHFDCAPWHPDPWPLKQTPMINSNVFQVHMGYKRSYWGHIHDMMETTVNSSYLTYWSNHYDSLLPDEDFAFFLEFQLERADWITNEKLPAFVAYEITTNGGNDFSTSGSSVLLSGTGWINIRRIEVAGRVVQPEFTWLDMETWSVSLDLAMGANVFELKAYDYQGNEIGVDTITATRN